MANDKTVTGSRDDLLMDASRCLRMRYSESGCRRCVDICPHGAIMLDGGLAIIQELCRGCLLCAAVCPAGALEQKNDFSACLAQLSRVPEPILGCCRTKEHSHASLTCLGGLSEEHLLTLCQSLSGSLIFNMTTCSGCPNSTMVPYLHQRLADLHAAGLPGNGSRFLLIESAQDIRFRDESVDRRGFFKSMVNSLFQGAAGIISTGGEQIERRTEYAGKRLPVRRELLNKLRDHLSPETEASISKRFDFTITFHNSCTTCHGCVAICPTGALQSSSPDEQPQFDPRRCTGCGLCVEFCLDGAIRIFPSRTPP